MVVVVLTTTGAGSWTVPAGVTSVVVECWGAGAAGSQGYPGGGGAWSKSTLSVTPAASMAYFVGSGVSRGGNPSDYDGQDSWFGSTSTVLAKGGRMLYNNALNGGSEAAGVGQSKFSGGRGLNGGGGAASPTGAGQSAASTTNGDVWITSHGTNGGSSNSAGAGATTAGTPGVSHPDGGGGGTALSGGSAGGAPGGGSGGGAPGGRGQIRITYVDPSPPTGGTTVTLNSTATLFAAIGETNYAAAREKTGVNLYAGEFGWVGQYLDAGLYEVDQVFARFDLSSLPAGAVITGAKLILTVAESYGTHTIEARASAFTAGNAASFIAGSQLASKTLLGSASMTDGFNVDRAITLSDLTPANIASVVLFGQGQRTGTAPTGGTATRVTAVKLEVTYSVVTSPFLITTSGAGSWTVPPGVASITVECWGGGGGGIGGNAGGGGAYARKNTLAVTPGSSLAYTVGIGAPGTGGAAGVTGGDTWFGNAVRDSAPVMAKGGTMWLVSQPNPTYGRADQSVGDFKFNGGGGTGSFYGGGGSASPTGAGVAGGSAAGSYTGGSSPGAGAGGGPGVAGVSNVDGGGGGGGHATANAGNGGAPGGGGGAPGNTVNSLGGRGQIRISWDAGTPDPITRLHRTFFWL